MPPSSSSAQGLSHPMHPEVHTHSLSCGMTLMVAPVADVGVATVDVWVGTGAAHEAPSVAGVSHFLEHMFFKGSNYTCRNAGRMIAVHTLYFYINRKIGIFSSRVFINNC